MITVRIFYLNGTEDVKDYLDESQIVLDGVQSFKIIRDERLKIA